MFKAATVNHEAFASITEDSAYWIGFLMADGCVTTSKNSSGKLYRMITLSLSTFDRDHIKRFVQFLGSTRKVTDAQSVTNYGQKRNSVVSVWSDRLCDDLARHGVVPRKSTRETVPSHLKLNKDYWRGMVDGDGTVRMTLNRGYQYPDIILGGTENVCSAFNSYVQSLGVRPSKIGNCRGLRFVRFNGRPAKTVIASLYAEASTALPRKLSVAKDCLAWVGRLNKKVRD